jgi:CBS domain-containing protein
MERTPLKNILADKGSDLYTIEKTVMVQEAVCQMASLKIAAILILKDGKPEGIFTERDVLRKIVCEGRDPKTTPLSEVMSINLTTLTPENFVSEASALMTNSRIRHIPIIDDAGKCCGLISIGDVSRFYMLEQKKHIDHLQDYITGDHPTNPNTHHEQ